MRPPFNAHAVEVLDRYFGAGEWTIEALEVDAFFPGTGWVPVTRWTLFDPTEFAAAEAAGVTSFAISTHRRGPVDFRLSELVPAVVDEALTARYGELIRSRLEA